MILLSHLLSVVDEGVVGADKEDVLRLQVSVSQLVVMENCWQAAEGKKRGAKGVISEEPRTSSAP